MFETRKRYERDYRFDRVREVVDAKLAGIERATVTVTVEQIQQAVKTAHGQALNSNLIRDAVNYWSTAGRYSIPHIDGDGNTFTVKLYTGTRGVLAYEREGAAL